jgi:hypothetical protein
MSPAQIRKYRLLWGKVRRHYRAAGLEPMAADAKRHQIHVRALGRDKSSLDFTNHDFDEVLKHFLAILEPDNLMAQLAILEQPEQRMGRARDLCVELVSTLPQIKAAVNPANYADNYLDSLARRVRGKNFADLDEAGLQVIHGILAARIKPEPEEDGDPF